MPEVLPAADSNAHQLVEVNLRAKAIDAGPEAALRSAYGFLMGAVAGVRQYGGDRVAVSMLMLTTRSIMRGNPELDDETDVAAVLRGQPVERKKSRAIRAAAFLFLAAAAYGGYLVGRSF